jgi:hypothetical protein
VQLYWGGITRFHNWFDRRRTVPHRMLSQAQQAGLIGSVDWVAVGPDDERKDVEHKGDTLKRLLNHRPKRGESYRIAAGGARPTPWQMTLGLDHFKKSEGQVKGYNILNIWFEAEPWAGPDRSDALVQTFRAIHTPDDTEVAFIHPYDRWSELSDTLNGRYGEPVTFGPFFSGVYWANFLGRGHLALFDLSRLRDLQIYEVEWTGEDGLFIRVCRDVSDATNPTVEEKMFHLTERFRAARLRVGTR